MAVNDPTDPKTIAGMQQATQAVDDYGKSLAGLRKETESLEKAASSFYKMITDEGQSLSSVTKLFYDNINAVAELRKNFGDLQSTADSTAEKISLMRGAMVEAETVLRDSVSKRIEYNKQLADTKKQIEELQKAKEAAGKELEATLAAEIQKRKELQAIANDETRSEDERVAALKEYTELTKKLSDLSKSDQTLRLAMLEVDKEQIEENQKKLQLSIEQAAATLPLLRYEKQREEATEKINDYMDGIVSKLTKGAERSNIFGAAVLAMQKSVDGADKSFGSIISHLGAGLKETLLDPEKAANRVFNIINDSLIKSTLEFDAALAKVGQSSGGFRKEFESIAMNMGGVSFVALSQYGVTLGKFGEAYQSLSRSIGGFNSMLDAQKKLLTENAAAMNTLGVSADTYGKLVSKFMGAIGKTAEGSRDMINSLAKDAIALGKSVGEYTSQFESAMSRISGYGREAIGIFKELEAVSAATKGVVTSQDLLSISDRFKDFDSAADAVSKLNAILGGTSVNILDMMKADPAEQIMMIKRAAGEAGLEFDKLNMGYKRLLAEYFGGDINKAQAFFNANIAEAQGYLDKAVESEEELAKRKEQNVAFQEKLNALIDNMKVGLTSILGPLNYVIGGITKIMSFPGAPLVLTIGMIVGSITLMRVAFDRVIERIMAKVAAVQNAAAASEAASAKTVAANKRETASVTEVTEALRQKKALEQAPDTPVPKKGISPGMKAGWQYAGLGLTTMGLGTALQILSSNIEESRQERIEKRRSNLKIEEMEAEKRLFGSAVTPRNTEAIQANDIAIINGKEIILNEKDKYFSLQNILPGAFGFGVEGGPIAQASAAKMESANSALASNVAAKETAAKESKTAGNMPPPAAAGSRDQSSNTDKQANSPVNVNVKAYLQLSDNKVSELAVVLKDYEISKVS